MAAAGLVLDGRVLRIGPYTASANFRNPDGSRRRDKKKAKLRDQLGAGYSERKTKRKAPGRQRPRRWRGPVADVASVHVLRVPTVSCRERGRDEVRQ